MFRTVALLSIAFSSVAVARPGGDDRRPPPPPREAIEVCADAVADDTCSFTGRNDETVTGTCQPGPRPDLPLACRPDDAPER